MMHCSKADLPAVFEAPQGMWRMTEWEGMNIEYMSFEQEVDPGPLLYGLPDSLCSCPHWGYVIQGQVRIMFADHEEIYNAGDVCYIAPGHRPVFGANTEFVAFSLAESYRPVMEVIRQNLAALSR
jgi:hypothetical protein